MKGSTIVKHVTKNQYKTNPNGPEKYTRSIGVKTKPRDILYFIASLEIHEPKKRFTAKKCNQKTSKKLSVANTVYKLSKFRYNLKISMDISSNKIAW